MLDGLRRWLGGGARQGAPAAVLAQWAAVAGGAFKPVREGEGGVIEFAGGARGWRMEWGDSQRLYISGPELRMIAEVDVPRDMQILLINRDLAEALERAVFEQAVDDVRTRIDTQLPPEARWLVMHPKVPVHDMGALRLRYTALGASTALVAQWLASPFGEALGQTLSQVASTDPVVMTVGRGRLTLRTVMSTPDDARLTMWKSVFAAALETLPAIATAWRDADRQARQEATGESALLSRLPDEST